MHSTSLPDRTDTTHLGVHGSATWCSTRRIVTLRRCNWLLVSPVVRTSLVNRTKEPSMYAAAANTLPTVSTSRAPAARFTPLEQRVLRLAASGSERPSTTVEPRIRRLSRRLASVVMARRGGRELADPRLEALRSYGANIALGRNDGLATFYAAGYTVSHAAEVKRVVATATRAARANPHARRDRMVYAGGISIGLASLLGFVGMTGTLLAGY